MKILKKNCIFIIFLLISVLCFCKKDNVLPMDVVSYPDGWETFSANEKTLEQTWISEVKKIREISIDVIPMNSFEDNMELQILEGSSRNVIFSAKTPFSFEEGVPQTVSFDLGSLMLNAGKQYILQLSFSTPSDNKLNIRTGSNYMGCSIGGEARNVGAAFSIQFIKYSFLFWAWATFFPIFSFAFFCMVYFERKWEEVVGVALAALIFVLFSFGLSELLEIGVIVSYVLASLCFVVGVILYNKKDMTVKDLWSPGLLFFAVVLVLIILNAKSLRFARWDEFSHWGLAVKDMFFSDMFAKHPGSTVMLKYYPPVSTLIEYFCCYTNGLFSESMVYVGFQLFCLSTLCCCLGGLKRRKFFTVAVLIFFTPMIFFEEVYHCIYADPLLACCVAFVLIAYYKEKLTGFNLLRVIGGLFLLTLTKDVGVVIAGLLTLIMLGDTIYRQLRQKKWRAKDYFRPFICLFWVCFLFFLWQFYLSVPVLEENTDVVATADSSSAQVIDAVESIENDENEVIAVKTVENVEHDEPVEGVESGETVKTGTSGAVGASGISLGGVLDLFRGEDGGYRYQVLKNFVSLIFSTDIFHFDIISFSYFDFSIVLLIISVIFSGIKYVSDNERKLVSFGIFSFGAGLGYCIFLLITYLFSFSQIEALLFSSFHRYIGSYVAGVFIAFITLLIQQMDGDENKFEKALLLIISAIVIIATPMERFVTTNMDTELTDNQVYGFDKLAEIVKSGANQNDKVFFICNNSDGYARLQMRTELVPLLADNNAYDIYSSKQAYQRQLEINSENDIEWRGRSSIIPIEQLESELRQYNYVILFHVDEMFADSYSELFEAGETIGDGTVYKVMTDENGVTLHYVGKTGIKEYR